jgi:hypothetical protein
MPRRYRPRGSGAQAPGLANALRIETPPVAIQKSNPHIITPTKWRKSLGRLGNTSDASSVLIAGSDQCRLALPPSTTGYSIS